jgi:hypothetical protein
LALDSPFISIRRSARHDSQLILLCQLSAPGLRRGGSCPYSAAPDFRRVGFTCWRSGCVASLPADRQAAHHNSARQTCIALGPVFFSRPEPEGDSARPGAHTALGSVAPFPACPERSRGEQKRPHMLNLPSASQGQKPPVGTIGFLTGVRKHFVIVTRRYLA